MAADVNGFANMCDQFCQVLRQISIAVAGQVWAVAVVAHVGGDHLPCVRHAFCDYTPIAPGPEQPMNNQKCGFGRFLAMKKVFNHV